MNEPKETPLSDLNQVLIEYGVFTDSMDERRKLLGPLIRVSTTDSQLREVCEWVRLSNPKIENLGAKIARTIQADPQLRAALIAARKHRSWHQKKRAPRPNEDGIAENTKRERDSLLARESRQAMRAHCAIKYGEAKDIADLAKQMGVTELEAAQLVKVGEGIYGEHDG